MRFLFVYLKSCWTLNIKRSKHNMVLGLEILDSSYLSSSLIDSLCISFDGKRDRLKGEDSMKGVCK
jgi:hypothetical protein